MIGSLGDGAITSFAHFLLWEQASREGVYVKRVYLDMAEDLAAGFLLSQIVYWHLPNDEGKSRLRVQVDDQLWLVKGYADWWDEIRLTAKQARRAVEILEEKGIITTCLKKFAGAPKLHIRIVPERFLELLNGLALQGKSICPTGQVHLPQEANSPAPVDKSYKQTVLSDTTTNTTTAADRPRRRAATKVFSDTPAAVDSGKTKEENPPDPELIALLIAEQVNRADAVRLAKDHPEEARKQLQYLPFVRGSVTSPGAYLRTAIEQGFAAPAAYTEAQNQQAKAEKRAAADQAAQAERQKAEQIQAQQAAALQQERERLQAQEPEQWQQIQSQAEAQLPAPIRARPGGAAYNGAMTARIDQILAQRLAATTQGNVGAEGAFAG